MLRDGNPIGAITVASAEPAMFSESQIALLKTFADQAVIAIENTRLFNELETRNRDLTESLEQQTATSEILRVISQSQRDVQPVFETIAANARKLCEATIGAVSHVRRRADPTGGCRGRQPRTGLEALRRVVPNATEPRRRDRTRHSDPSRRSTYRMFERIPSIVCKTVAEAVGFRSVLSVPMLREGSPIGAIGVVGAKPAMFSERQIAMLQTFADQAVIAIENTRLFNELQTRNRDLTESLEQQTATSEILRVISQSQRDVQPVFETIAANARKLCDATFGGVWTYDGRVASPRGHCGLQSGWARSGPAIVPYAAGTRRSQRPLDLDSRCRLRSGCPRGSRV